MKAKKLLLVFASSMFFWDKVLLPDAYQKMNDFSNISYCKKSLRWDIFEDHFLAFLNNTFNLENKKIRKVSISSFFKHLFTELASIPEETTDSGKWDNEVIYNPSSAHENPKYYSGYVVTKEAWVNFAKCGGLKRVFVQLAKSPMKEEQKIQETQRLQAMRSVYQITDKLYKYACGSIYKGQRCGGLRDGKGSLSISFPNGKCWHFHSNSLS